MNKLVLSLGSNSSDCDSQIHKCIEWLNIKLDDFKVSHIYETPATNGKDRDYLNTVVLGSIDVEYEVALRLMKDYEIKNGRTVDSKKYGSIPIDIDIVIWNDNILRENDFKQSYFQIGWLALNNNY